MRTTFAILLLASCTAYAADRITALVTTTNIPAHGQTLVVNGSTRTWSTNVSTPATEINVGATASAAETNLWLHIVAAQFPGPVLPRWGSTNAVYLVGAVGQAMSVAGSGWASVAYSTQSVTALQTVRVPLASEPEATRTNAATLLAIGLDYAQAPIPEYSTALSTAIGVTSTQTVSGPKIWTGHQTLLSVTTSNLVNAGSAISSPGTGTHSEQIGTSAVATNDYALAIGYYAVGGGGAATALGNGAAATGDYALAAGMLAAASGSGAIGIGYDAAASGQDSIAIGTSSSAAFSGSVAIGGSAATTTTNQIMLGSSGETTEIPGALVVKGTTLLASVGGTVSTLTNGTLVGPAISAATLTSSIYTGTIGALTNGLVVGVGLTNTAATNTTLRGSNILGGILCLPQATHTSLANGANAGVDPGTAAWVKLKPGPTAPFSIAGIAGGADGRLLVLQNGTSQLMTLSNDSGVEPTAANRILTGVGADVVLTNHCVTLLYDTDASRWIMLGPYHP